MKYKNRSGLYVGKLVGRCRILYIFPKIHDLTIDCVVSDGSIWRFEIYTQSLNFKIGVIRTSMPLWVDNSLVYCIIKIRRDTNGVGNQGVAMDGI